MGEEIIDIRGLFYAIGHTPNSGFVANQLEVDPEGYILSRDGVRTSQPGIFVAGDVADKEWRQAVSAAGTGCMAAIAAERYLAHEGLLSTIEEGGREIPSEDVLTTAKAEKAEMAKKKQEVSASDTEETFDPARVKHKGQYALRKLYHESDRLIVVLFTSQNCGPCSRLKPTVNKVVEAYGERVHFVEIDVEEDPEIADASSVMGTPHTQFFYNKDRVGSFAGVKMKSEYLKLCETVIGQPNGKDGGGSGMVTETTVQQESVVTTAGSNGNGTVEVTARSVSASAMTVEHTTEEAASSRRAALARRRKNAR